MGNPISINEVKHLVPYYWAAGQSVMIWGEPGIGKSDGIRQVAAERRFTVPANEAISSRSEALRGVYGHEQVGCDVYDIRLLLCQPTDIKGIPVYNPVTSRGEWVNTGMFPTSEADLRKMENTLVSYYDELDMEGSTTERKAQVERLIFELENAIKKGVRDQYSIIFLDEISIAPKMVQGAALQLVLDRTVGTYCVPKNVHIVAAGNRSSDRSGATAMSPPLASRFAHLTAGAPSFADWLENYAMQHNTPPSIIGFLRFKPEMMHVYKPDTMNGSANAPSTFPCPRTWTKVAELFNTNKAATDLDSVVLENLVAGVIGEGAAAEFVAWLNIYNRLPSPESVLDEGKLVIEWERLARSSDKDDIDRSVKSRALSLRFAFFHSLATQFVKRCEIFVAARDEAMKSNNTAKLEKLKEQFDYMACNFFKFVNAKEEDIEFGMLIMQGFLLKNSAVTKLMNVLRGLKDPQALGNVERILKLSQKYKAAA